MNEPPLLPPRDNKGLLEVKPICRKVFRESKRIRLGKVDFDYSLIEASHIQAEDWINNNPAIDIVQIQTFHSSLNGITVVWYR